jgi:hypothetical protein
VAPSRVLTKKTNLALIGAQATEIDNEMRHLPDRVFYCPGCGCEVLPLAASEGKSARAAAEYTFSECSEIDSRRRSHVN